MPITITRPQKHTQRIGTLAETVGTLAEAIVTLVKTILYEGFLSWEGV